MDILWLSLAFVIGALIGWVASFIVLIYSHNKRMP